MKATLVGLTLAISLTAGGAWAADPDDLQKLNDTGNCVKCNLSGANLEFAILSRADLSRADLKGANLSNANLFEADLKFAIMNGAILCNTIVPDGSVIYSGC